MGYGWPPMLRLSIWSQDDSHHVTYLFPIIGSNTSRKTSPHLAPFRCFLFMLFYSPLLRFRWVGGVPLRPNQSFPPPLACDLHDIRNTFLLTVFPHITFLEYT